MSLALKVVPPSFTVGIADEPNSCYLGKGVAIQLFIKVLQGANLPKCLCLQSSLKGAFTYADKACEAGDTIDIGTRTDIELRFQARDTGIAQLVFTFIDPYEQTQQASLSLTAQSPPFRPTATVVGEKSIFTNQVASLQLHIKNPESVNLKKSLQFQSNRQGKLVYQGEEYTENTAIDIGTQTELKLGWKPQKAGKAELTFTLSDAYERSQKTQAEIEVKDVPFDVSVTAQADQGSRLVNKGSVQFTVNPQGKASGIAYHWRYSVTGTGAGVLDGYREGSPYPANSGQSISCTYHIDRESGPQASGTHRISITVADNYGQTITQDLAFEVVKFPRITDVDSYYEARDAFFGATRRLIRVQHIKGKKGSYPIAKVKIEVHDCRGKDGKFTINKEFNYEPDHIDYDPYRRVFTLYDKIDKHDRYMKDCGCETGKARATFWLIDTQGNESRPLTKTMRAG